jgi:CubicO group peptidase (beta-lactamase class C family)
MTTLPWQKKLTYSKPTTSLSDYTPAILRCDDTRPAPGTLEAAASVLAGGAGAPPGAVLAVSREGEIEHCAVGSAQAFSDVGPLPAPVAFTLDTSTDLGSVTKVVATTTAIMTLAAAGAVALEQTLGEILPWAASEPCATATLAQLLTHRAGLWEWWPLYLTARDPEPALRLVAARPLRYAPEHGRHYSDLGFQLLGAAVAQVAGRPLDDAAQELALDAIGLRATRYGRPDRTAAVAASSTGDRIERQMIRTGEPYPVGGDADAFGAWRSHVLVGEVNDGNAFHALGSVAGHAGLFSTARDLLGFGDALLRCLDGAGPLPAATVRRFLTPGADPGQGLGFRRWATAAGDAWGHTGFPGVGVAIVPALGATVAMVTNRLHVAGAPRATEPMWEVALRAACEPDRRPRQRG